MSSRPNCREIADFLADYVDHQLPAERHAEFEMHLTHCKCCSHYLSSYRDTIRLCRDAVTGGPECEQAPPPPPEALVAAICKVLRKES